MPWGYEAGLGARTPGDRFVGGMGLGMEVSGTPSLTLARATPIFCICILGF